MKGITRRSLAQSARASVVVALICALVASVAGCAADDSGSNSPRSDSGANGSVPCVGANDCRPGQICNAFGRCTDPPRPVEAGTADGGPDGAPPEVEERIAPPAAGKRFVYVAIADQDMVVKIDATTLRVRTIKVGRNPGALRTVGGEDIALLLERGDAKATLLRSQSDGSDKRVRLDTVAGVNQLALSPDGTHAIAYYDPRESGGTLPGQALQEISVLRLRAGSEQSVRMSVGFLPSDVQFTADGSKAFVVSEQGLSIIDLSGALKPAIVPTVMLRSASEAPPGEVRVTSDGSLALLRIPGLAALRAVDLPGGTRRDVALAGEPSDIDVTPDGKLAVVVLRDQKQLALVDLPADLDDAGRIETRETGLAVGQAALSADGKRALLFTNASKLESVVLAQLSGGGAGSTGSTGIEALPLKKAVRSVMLAPGGKTALIIHNKEPGVPSAQDPFEVFIDRSHAFSLIELDKRFVKLQLTSATPGPAAFSAGGGSVYVLAGDRTKSIREVIAVDLTSFVADEVALGSHPLSVGVVAQAGQIYVAQSHALGRVTFIDAKTRQTRTLTGFALNSEVIE